MTSKRDGGLKFQIEVLERLYRGEPVKEVQVSAPSQNFAWGFTATWYGFDNGEFLRRMPNDFILTPQISDFVISFYSTSQLEIGGDYDFGGLNEVIKGEAVEVKDGRKKRKVIKLTSPKASATIDTRYLEYFKDNVRFLIKDEFSPVLIVAERVPIIIGLIHPFVMKR